jgi:hypothetical protein
MRELTGGELVEVAGGKGDKGCKASSKKGSSKKGSSKKGSSKKGGKSDCYRWGNGDSDYC